MNFLTRKCNLTLLCRQFWVYVPQLFSRKKLKQNTTIFLFIFSFSIIQFVSWKHYDSTYVNHIPRKLNEGIPLNRLLCIFLFCIYKFGKFKVCYVHLDKFLANPRNAYIWHKFVKWPSRKLAMHGYYWNGSLPFLLLLTFFFSFYLFFN